MKVEPNEALSERLEVEPEEDNQLQTALEVFEKGVDAVKEELESQAESVEETEAFPQKDEAEDAQKDE